MPASLPAYLIADIQTAIVEFELAADGPSGDDEHTAALRMMELLQSVIQAPASSPDLTAVRRVQYAANMLSYTQFLAALGWERDDYSLDKWKQFQQIGVLGRFDSDTLIRLMNYHEKWEHPATQDCPDEECTRCGERDCPHGEPLHYHHDGCPACTMAEDMIKDKYGDA